MPPAKKADSAPRKNRGARNDKRVGSSAGNGDVNGADESENGRADESVNVCDCYLYSYCLGYQYKRHGDGARRGR